MSDDTLEAARIAQVEDELRQQYLGTSKIRAQRWIQVQRVPIAPSTHFSLPSSECSLLYRDGYSFACIALCQAVAESLVRWLCERNALSVSKSFDTNLSRLRSASVLKNSSIGALERVWADRNDFLHVNRAVSRDPSALQSLAFSKLQDLAAAEHDAFAADYSGGKLTVERPKHWP